MNSQDNSLASQRIRTLVFVCPWLTCFTFRATANNKISFAFKAVSDDVFDDVATEGILSCIRSKTIGEWESEDPKTRIKLEETNGKSKSSKSDAAILKKDVPKSLKLKLKGGGYVDPDSGLEDKAHVLKARDTLFSAVLGAVDIATGRNSYYKIQVSSIIFMLGRLAERQWSIGYRTLVRFREVIQMDFSLGKMW